MMHPSEFIRLRSGGGEAAPSLSPDELKEKLADLGTKVAEWREEAVTARKESGIELIWLRCEEDYLSMDDLNRGEFDGAKWSKPMNINGPLTQYRRPSDDLRSTAFVRLVGRYVDGASSKMSEITLPIDGKPFSLSGTPTPDLIMRMEDDAPISDPATGQPLMRPQAPEEMPLNQPQAAQQAAPKPVPVTSADIAKHKMQQAEEAAKKAETRIYDYLIESNYHREARKVHHDGARLGSGALKGPIPIQTKARAIVKTGDGVTLEQQTKVFPGVKWVDPWNLFPADGCGENIHDGNYIFERDYLSEKSLRHLKDDETYIAENIDKVIEEGPGKVYQEGKISERKTNASKRYEIWYCYAEVSYEDLCVCVHDQDLLSDADKTGKHIPVIFSLVNETIIKAVPNPDPGGAFPYRLWNWSRRSGSCWGVGVAEQLRMPQEAVNAATRTMFNNAGVSSGVQFIIDDTAITPADNKWVITPNKVWRKTGDSSATAREAFAAIEIPNIQAQMSGVIAYGMKLAEESCNIPLITQGQEQPVPQTFGQAELQNNNAHTWLRSVANSYDDQITKPLIEAYYDWLIADPDVPNDEKGDFQINATGSIVMVERAIQEQTYISLLQMANNPAFMLDPELIADEYLLSKRIRPDDVKLSESRRKQIKEAPPSPPIELAVEQAKGQNAMQLQQAKMQAEAQLAQQAQPQGGGPAAQVAQAKIAQERIRADTALQIQESRANTDMAKLETQREIAFKDEQLEIAGLQLRLQLAQLESANRYKMQLDQVKADMATSAMDNETKRQLAAAEIQLAQSQSALDRDSDMHNNTVSLIRDEISTNTTP